MTKSSMLRAVELDRPVHEIVEARRAVGHAEADGARTLRRFARGDLGRRQRRQVRSYFHAPPAASAASRFAFSSSGVQ